MRVIYSANFARQFDAVPAEVQRAFRKQVSLLVENLRHPALRAKKYDQARDIWQARVTGSWRFYFRIEDDAYQVLTIHSHPK
jgi:mRNA-degrading endonuclease RelE of RelBE toxin-antitoxin system